MSGRIVFPKNPWPDGHRIKRFAWTGRLDDRGLWFDLHLESADYYEGDRFTEPEEVDPPGGAWASKIVWGNYHACILSSTYWGVRGGVPVGAPGDRYDVAALDGRTFRVAPLPRGAADVSQVARFPFQIYLLGHDSVADHRIAFRRRRGGEHAIDWTGRIALTYAGATRFTRTFRATIPRARFAGFTVAPGLPRDVARDLLALYTRDPAAYRLERGRFVVARGG